MRRWWARRPGKALSSASTMPAEPDPPDHGRPVGRRVALGLLGLGTLGIVTGTRTQNAVTSFLAPIQLRDPTGLTGVLPLGDTFRYYSVTGGVPTRDASSYRLAISGLVDRPSVLTLADLQAMPQTDLVRDFQCVTGWRVPQVHWSGVRLSTILDRAGVQTSGRALRLTSFDGTYSDSLTLDQARLPDVLVAVKSLTTTVDRCACTSRRCTATRASSGSPGSRSPTRSFAVTGSTAGTTSTGSSVSPTGVMMSAPETGAPPETGQTIDRFSRGSRWVHWLTATFMLTCILTAAVLYNSSIAIMIGHRYVVEQIHVYSGFALPVPLIVGIVSRGYRDDARRLNRFTSRDWAWLRSRTRRDGRIQVGKFNAGQKLNAALSAGSIAVLLVSGVTMYFTNLAPLPWRSGATFMHDWFALAVGLLVVGHILMAFKDPYAMAAMRTGKAPLRWARREHGAWAREVAGDPPAAAPEHSSRA
jgi:formate dehydrogenase subunit gamma